MTDKRDSPAAWRMTATLGWVIGLWSGYAFAADWVGERREVARAPNWTYQYRAEIDEFDDSPVPRSHYVSTSNFDDEKYENFARGQWTLPRLESKHGEFYVDDPELVGAVRLALHCVQFASAAPSPWLDLTLKLSERPEDIRIEGDLQGSKVWFDLLMRVDRKRARTFRQVGRTAEHYVRFQKANVTLTFGDTPPRKEDSASGLDSLDELVDYLKGGTDLIIRVPGFPQTFRLNISGFDRAYALIKRECQLKHDRRDAAASDNFSFLFHVGAQGTTVEQLEAKATPRVHAQISQRIASSAYLDGDIRLTSTGELSRELSSPSGSSASDMNVKANGVDQVLEANISSYVLADTPKYGYRIGLSVLTGLRQRTSDGPLVRRYYGGVRIANDPDVRSHYLEVLYGKTEDLQGGRLELRGQMPIRNEQGKSIAFIGAYVNFAVSDTDMSHRGDSISFYLTVPFRQRLEALIQALRRND